MRIWSAVTLHLESFYLEVTFYLRRYHLTVTGSSVHLPIDSYFFALGSLALVNCMGDHVRVYSMTFVFMFFIVFLFVYITFISSIKEDI